MIKWFKIIVTYAITPAVSVVGFAYGFDRYVIGRANTAVEPVAARVASLESGHKDTNAMLRVLAVHMMGEKKFEKELTEEKVTNP